MLMRLMLSMVPGVHLFQSHLVSRADGEFFGVIVARQGTLLFEFHEISLPTTTQSLVELDE